MSSKNNTLNVRQAVKIGVTGNCWDIVKRKFQKLLTPKNGLELQAPPLGPPNNGGAWVKLFYHGNLNILIQGLCQCAHSIYSKQCTSHEPSRRSTATVTVF